MFENPAIKKIFLFMLVFSVILSSFYILDFKVSQSDTQANSVVSSYSSGNPQFNLSDQIFLYVEGDGALKTDLREKLTKDLEAAGSEVVIVNKVDKKYDSQALLVNISKDNWLYTPVYASSTPNLVFFTPLPEKIRNISNNSKKETKALSSQMAVQRKGEN